MKILGISSYYHDSAACLLIEGHIASAAQEERFTRIKHDPAFPLNAIKYCLSEAKLDIDEIDYIAFYDKPILKFDRIFETYLAFAPKGFLSFSKSFPTWVKDKLFQKSMIIKELSIQFGSEVDWNAKLLFSEHHLSHAASAFFPSPFREAAILTMDGVGEWSTTSVALGVGNSVEIIKQINFPHSLGLLYSAFTQYTGFKVNSGEYKVMGLAPYGEPIYVKKIKDNLIDIKEDGSFHMNMSYFDYCTGLTMTNSKFHNLFGGPPRLSESDITQKDMNLAASIQQVAEEIIIKIANNISKETKQSNLCLAGGVALNCVANGKILKQGLFKQVWVQPAAGDAGGALGAALAIYHMHAGKPRVVNEQKDSMQGSFLGPCYSDNKAKFILDELGAVYEDMSEESLLEFLAFQLSEGRAVGWHQGRMEFGPRALGSRSILADPRLKETQRELNLKIKFRESFRPFAPSILREELSKWFDLDVDSPYMLFVSKVNPEILTSSVTKMQGEIGLRAIDNLRSTLPAVTHVDFSARIQTVSREEGGKFYRLLKKFQDLTGCPVLVNTSFNIRGEPIVESPKDAFKCFMGTNLDYLVVGNLLLKKENQTVKTLEDYRGSYKLD